jgi:hypothetical protein
MKITNPIHKLSALICVICGLTLLPLTVTAQQQASGAYWAVNGTTVTQTGTTYSTSVGSAHALMVRGTSNYTGYDITLTSTGANARGLHVDANSTVTGSNWTIHTYGDGGRGVVVVDSTANLSGLSITTEGGSYALGLQAAGSAIVNVGANAEIVTKGDTSYGVYFDPGAVVHFGDNAVITSDGNAAAYVNSGTLTFTSGALLTSNQGYGVRTFGDGYIDLGMDAKIVVKNHMDGALLVNEGGRISGTNTQINSDGFGIKVEGDGFISLENPTIEADNEVINVNNVEGGSATIDINGGHLTSNSGNLINNELSGFVVNIILNDVDASNAGGINIGDNNGSETNIAVTGGSGIHGDVTNSGSGTLNLGLNDSSVTGNINNNNGTVSSTGTSAITGDVNSSLEVSSGTLTVTGSVTVDNGQSVTGNGTLNVGGLEINDGGTLGGGLTLGTDSASRILIGLSSATLYHEFGSLTEIGTDTMKLGDNIALDLSGIDGLSGFTFAFTDEVQNGNFTLILGEAGSLENWAAEINGSISGLTLSGQNEVTADITITLNGDGSALTATLSNVTVTAVPEPSTYFLIGTGLGLLLLTARCRRQAGTDA